MTLQIYIVILLKTKFKNKKIISFKILLIKTIMVFNIIKISVQIEIYLYRNNKATLQ